MQGKHPLAVDSSWGTSISIWIDRPDDAYLPVRSKALVSKARIGPHVTLIVVPGESRLRVLAISRHEPGGQKGAST